jgi:hypothetical protein
MAISGKPPKSAPPSPAPPPDEREVLSLIHKGGSIAKAAAPNARDADKPMLVQLRLYPEMVADIDAVRSAAKGGRQRRAPSRHAWIVQAIEEKLARDRQGS